MILKYVHFFIYRTFGLNIAIDTQICTIMFNEKAQGNIRNYTTDKYYLIWEE